MTNWITRLFGRERADEECIEVRGYSSDYIDDELDEETTQRVKDHLERCPRCPAFFKTLMATVGLLRSQDSSQPPESFRARLIERLRREASH